MLTLTNYKVGSLAFQSPLVSGTNIRTIVGNALLGSTDITLTNLGIGNVDNTSDATKNAAAVTLTNKTLTNPVINGFSGTGNGSITGTLSVSNGATFGTGSNSPVVSVDSSAGGFANYSLKTAGSLRWAIEKSGTESGSNVGGDLNFYRYSDAGSYLASALTINRSSGLVTASSGLSVTGRITTNAGLGVNAYFSSDSTVAEIGTVTNHLLSFFTYNTQRAILTATGNFLVGGVTAAELGAGYKNLQVDGTSGSIIQAGYNGGAGKVAIYVDATACYVGARSNQTLNFIVNNSAKAQIDTNGKFIALNGTQTHGNTTQHGYWSGSIAPGGTVLFNILDIIGQYSGGRVRVRCNENGINSSYTEYYVTAGYYGPTGSYTVTLVRIGRAQVNNNYGEGYIYLAGYGGAYTDASQTVSSTTYSDFVLRGRNGADAGAAMAVSVEYFT